MTVKFTLDGREVERRHGRNHLAGRPAARHQLPHLCYSPEPGYRADGNCRACMVEIEGERVLAASCIRKPANGMKVTTGSDRAKTARKMVFDLLVSDQPDRATAAHDPSSKFWAWADRMGVAVGRFPKRHHPQPDRSHTAMAVNLDACIQCNLCVRACREVQVNDVIGMAGRGHLEKIVFDFDDPMGASTCVACGECVQACPTGALMPATLVDAKQCAQRLSGPRGQFGVPVLRRRLPAHLPHQGRQAPLRHRQGRPRQSATGCASRAGSASTMSTIRSASLQPMIRKDGVPKHVDDAIDPRNPWTHFRPATWEEALDRAASGLKRIRDRDGNRALAGFGSAKGSNEEAYLFQKLVRTGFGSNNVDHCTRLCHASSVAALLEGVGSGRRDGDLQRVQELRRHRRDRRQPDREPSGRRDLLQAGGQARRQAHRDGPARPGAQAPRHPHDAVHATAPTSRCSTRCST